MLMNHPTEELCRSARSQFDQAGIRCVSYYSATVKEDADLENAIRFAQILGARNVTGDATGAILNRIDQRFTQEHLTFGIHNHYFKGEKFAYESPEDVLHVLKGLSNTMGATADVGHFVSCGHDPVEALRKLGPRLKLVHLKDIQAAGGDVNVLLGQGIAKVPCSHEGVAAPKLPATRRSGIRKRRRRDPRHAEGHGIRAQLSVSERLPDFTSRPPAADSALFPNAPPYLSADREAVPGTRHWSSQNRPHSFHSRVPRALPKSV